MYHSVFAFAASIYRCLRPSPMQIRILQLRAATFILFSTVENFHIRIQFRSIPFYNHWAIATNFSDARSVLPQNVSGRAIDTVHLPTKGSRKTSFRIHPWESVFFSSTSVKSRWGYFGRSGLSVVVENPSPATRSSFCPLASTKHERRGRINGLNSVTKESRGESPLARLFVPKSSTLHGLLLALLLCTSRRARTFVPLNDHRYEWSSFNKEIYVYFRAGTRTAR